MIKKIITHFLALSVGIVVTVSFTVMPQFGGKEDAPADMTVVVYRVAEELMEPKTITTNSNFRTSLDTEKGKPIDLSIKKVDSQSSSTVSYQNVTVNGVSMNIDSNGTAVFDDIMVVLVDHSKYDPGTEVATR
ncbi:hypothetical protein [Microbulbifer hainanensis]|uniref:hypothetical protein n=1 Tax=Microbulbifer hainanensis TaxID=2735675 RepID=UPI00186828C3|nr:hypothetical protein [Microbulbifer hainanensis]